MRPRRATATVYLTDGIERLDLPGKIVEFDLHSDWKMRGIGVWRWPHQMPGTVAGYQIMLHNASAANGEFYLEPPLVVKHKQEIRITMAIEFENFNHSLTNEVVA